MMRFLLCIGVLVPVMLVVVLRLAHAQPVSDSPTKRSVEATRTPESVQVDGRLDEPTWRQAKSIRGFVQNEPDQGVPATFDTEVRLLFDETHLYVGAVLHDPLGPAGLRVPVLQRDFDYDASDVFSLILDPFGDERNAFVFQVNPYGAQRDLQVREGITFNTNWDAVWTARTHITAEGWTTELAIPWATLRYPAPQEGEAPIWGVNFMRGTRRLGETSGWVAWPRSYSPYHMQFAGELRGLEPPPPRMNARVQPYVLLREERTGGESNLDNLDRAKFGGDLKWAVSTSTVLDLTVNTDFAQAEADAQVVNLARYSVFFPEKRAFFLESAGTFDLGYSLFTPFYSRRIGLENGRPVPLDAGLRLTRSTSTEQVGALLIRQRETDFSPASHFAIGRLSRNLGRGGARLGGLVVARHDGAFEDEPATSNIVTTVDGYARLSPTARVTAFISGSRTSGRALPGNGFASYLWLRNNAEWGYVGFLQDIASKHYEASTGFIFRQDVLLNSPAATLDWRPSWRPNAVRKFDPGFSSYVYHRLSDGAFLQADIRVTPIGIAFKNSAYMSLSTGPTWQTLDAEEAAFFRPLGAEIAAGDYRYTRVRLQANSDLTARMVASSNLEIGGFYDGRLSTFAAEMLARPSPHITFKGRYELNAARDLGTAAEEVTSHLVAAEARLALNPRLQFLAFYQYNTLADLGTWNVRLSYEFRPLSYIYLVFNDARYFVSTTQRMAQPALFEPQQQFFFKVNYLAQL